MNFKEEITKKIESETGYVCNCVSVSFKQGSYWTELIVSTYPDKTPVIFRAIDSTERGSLNSAFFKMMEQENKK